MGLQTWPPSTPPLSSMACLDVETPSICRGKFKSVLQLCLQQRRTREQLVEQGIMPPLKTPAAFHEQIRSLERARTGNFLKHKLCRRPERSELVRMHILQETQAEPLLQATQMKLKRARLEDDLNEKIAQRPGPMELVEKKILPVEEVTNEDKVNPSKPEDIYSFDEDSSDSHSQQSPTSTSTSPRDAPGSEPTSTSSSTDSNSPMQHSPPPNLKPASDLVTLVSTSEQQGNLSSPVPPPITVVVPSVTAGPLLVKQSLPKQASDKSRSKKSKEPKPRVKKLKYHQYIPPDQKQELNEVPMDSAYARLLQQQQQFLQLQILSQQQQYGYQAAPPATLKPTTESQNRCSSAVVNGNVASVPVLPRHTPTYRQSERLPANLDELKVAELKMELKRRSLPVSGTKTDLIERLKSYQESSNVHMSTATDTAVTSQTDKVKLTPPVSPIASKVSSLGIEDSSIADSPSKLSDSPHRVPEEELTTETRSHDTDTERDKRLHEKERQIEELMRKLEHEQRLVEELKMQLEVEKRSQQGDSPPHLGCLVPVQVKEESKTPTSCSAPSSSPDLSRLVKQEEMADPTPQTQFTMSHQTVKQPESLQPVQGGSQVLLSASLPASAVPVQLTANSIKLHTTVCSAVPGLIQTSGQVPQKTEASAALQQQCRAHVKTWRTDSTAQSLLSTFPVSGCPVGASSCSANPTGTTNKSPPTGQPALLQQPKFTTHVSKCKDPPRYEDAVKQTRSLLTVQGPIAASQQMDDLFDVLIESGEISPFIRQDPPFEDKPLPVTASVTTLPINTVLSRPPPVVQVAQQPAAASHNPPTSLATLTPEPQLDTVLDGTLGAHTEPQTLKLMEELHSPVVTMEMDYNENTSPSPLNLHCTNMDSMDWLDLTLSVPAEGVNPLDMSTPVGVFSSDFLDAHELHLNWE